VNKFFYFREEIVEPDRSGKMFLTINDLKKLTNIIPLLKQRTVDCHWNIGCLIVESNHLSFMYKDYYFKNLPAFRTAKNLMD
jgi:hypothetical protein